MRRLAALLGLGLLSSGLLTSALGQALPVAQPTRVTSPGCCTGAAFTPDSSALLYLDRPPGARRTAVYSVPAAGGAAPAARFAQVAFYSPDLRYSVLPGRGANTSLRRLSDGQTFTLPTDGTNVLWAPDGLGGGGSGPARVAYTVSQQRGNYDQRRSLVYVATLGGAPQQVASTLGGGAIGWSGPGTLLLSGKSSPGDRDRALYTLTLDGGGQRTLNTALSFRDVQLGPGGRQVVYTIAFDTAAKNGLYLQSTAGGAPKRLDWYGSLRWRDATHLVYIPLTLDAPTHVLYEYDTVSGTSRALLNLGTKVLSDQWNVSPDGRRVFFQDARDAALYVARLP